MPVHIDAILIDGTQLYNEKYSALATRDDKQMSADELAGVVSANDKQYELSVTTTSTLDK